MKKKKQFKRLKREFNQIVHQQMDVLKENARLRGEMDEAIKNFSTMRFENTKLREENAKLRLENDLARMQLQDTQEKMRKPVFVPVK